MPIRDIIVLAGVIVSVPFCFLRPTFGIIVWTVMAFLNPHQQSWGPARHVPLSEMVAIATLTGVAVFSRDWRVLRTREIGLVVVLWVWFTFTSIVSTHTPGLSEHAPDTWYKFGVISKILLMAIVTAAVINNWVRLRWLFLAIAGSFAFFVINSVPWMILTAGKFRLYGPPGTMLADNNDFGLALNMTLPLFFFLAKTEESQRMRLLLGVTFVCTIPAIVFTYSRGALVGLAATFFLMFLRLRERLLLVPVLVCAALLMLFFTPEHWQERMDFRQDGAVLDASAKSRLNAWTYSWRLAIDYPITGGGLDAFTPALFLQYAPDPRDVHGPHSVYFSVLAEHGFPGLFLYLWLVGACFLTLRRIEKEASHAGDQQAKNYAVMCQFSLVAFLVTGTFLGRAYFDYFFTLVACTAILKAVWAQEQEVEELEPFSSEVTA